jgi:hypothetical protein
MSSQRRPEWSNDLLREYMATIEIVYRPDKVVGDAAPIEHIHPGMSFHAYEPANRSVLVAVRVSRIFRSTTDRLLSTGGTKHTLTVTKRPWLFMRRPLIYARQLLAKLILLSCGLALCTTSLAEAASSVEAAINNGLSESRFYDGPRVRDVTQEVCLPGLSMSDFARAAHNDASSLSASKANIPGYTQFIFIRSSIIPFFGGSILVVLFSNVDGKCSAKVEAGST